MVVGQLLYLWHIAASNVAVPVRFFYNIIERARRAEIRELRLAVLAENKDISPDQLESFLSNERFDIYVVFSLFSFVFSF